MGSSSVTQARFTESRRKVQAGTGANANYVPERFAPNPPDPAEGGSGGRPLSGESGERDAFSTRVVPR